MIKAIALLVATFSVLPTLTTARACTSGLTYCGHTLLQIGNYRKEIYDELKKNGEELTTWNTLQSIYECGAGGHGWIGYRGICSKGCHNAGTGKSDSCWD